MPKIMIINGPNLNMLGIRESKLYGSETLSDIKNLCVNAAKKKGLSIDFKQSNSEAEIINWIQAVKLKEVKYCGLIINAAGYTHTSIAILDALRMLEIPIIEVHLTDIKKREEYRKHSYISEVAREVICGKGAKGYELAISCL